MSQLNQIIAVEKPRKSEATRHWSDVYKLIQKPDLFNGMTRTYQPKAEDGEQLPADTTVLQVRSNDMLGKLLGSLADYFDVTAQKDWGNCDAVADVKIGETVLIESAPVTYLLFLEKQLADLHTFVGKLPVLNPAEEWSWDANANAFRSKESSQVKTKKVPRNHVKAEATQQHPAQVEVYTEDQTIGTWTITKFSGALPATVIEELRTRVQTLRDAVKFAREEANSKEVDNVQVGNVLLKYVFEPALSPAQDLA